MLHLPAEVARLYPLISRHLGRRRRFWEFLLGLWRREGLLAGLGDLQRDLLEAFFRHEKRFFSTGGARVEAVTTSPYFRRDDVTRPRS